VVNLVCSQKRYFKIDKNDRILQFSSTCFDASVEQIFIALFSGAALVLIDNNTLLQSDRFDRFISRHSITHIHAVPSFLKTIAPKRRSHLKRMVAGGDLCPVMLAKQWSPYCDFYNEYGPTETTITSIEIMVKEQDHLPQTLPIGKPIDNTFVYLLDIGMNLVPSGSPGELYIGGSGVARGYLNRPELTAEKFVLAHSSWLIADRAVKEGATAFPMSYELSAISSIYKTGDLGRWLSDGNIEFLGRIDQQVKIRGFRIELGEIENQLISHLQVKETRVIVREDERGDRYLCAYIVPADSANSAEMPGSREFSAYLSHKLPDYMVPSYFTYIDRMPLTPSGKVNREALPAPGFIPGDPDTFTAPRSEIEKNLADLWSEILNHPPSAVGIDDDFFLLGGHSLKAVLLAAKIRKKLEVKLPLAEVFKHPTIRKMAQCISHARKSGYTPLELAEQKEYYVLSPAQKRIFFLQRLDKETTAYNIFTGVELEGYPVRGTFENIFKKSIERHESFRTAVEMVDGEPVQRVHEDVEFEIEGLPAPPGEDTRKIGSREAETIGKYIKSFIRPFDLSRAPLLRAGLVKTGERHHVLLVDMHHIVTDGVSNEVFINELLALYSRAELPVVRYHYKDYSQWQHRPQQQAALEAQKAYWIKHFQGQVPILNLPADYARPPIQGFEGRTMKFGLTNEQLQRLKDLAGQQDATLFIILMAIYNIFLSKITGLEEIVLGTGMAGRGHPDTRDIIGLFVNTLALRIYPGNSKTFGQFLEEVKTTTLEALENQDYPFEELVEKVVKKRDTSRNPLFDTMFIYQNFYLQKPGNFPHLPGLQIKPLVFDPGVSKFDLTLYGEELGDQLHLCFEYSTNLFKETTIRCFTRHFLDIVSAATRAPNKKLAEIKKIPDRRKKQILHQLNEELDREIEIINNTGNVLQHRLDKSPDKFKDTTAIEYGDNVVTYARLNQRAGDIAARIVNRGIIKGTFIGLFIRDRLELIAAILGILQAGCVFIPLDNDLPENRLELIINTTNIRLIISDETSFKKSVALRIGDREVLDIKESCPGSWSANKLPVDYDPVDLIYIYFTSGTTGTPKAIPGKNKSLLHFIDWEIETFAISKAFRISQLTTPVFDAFLRDVFVPLCSGGTLCIPANREKLPGSDELIRWIDFSGVQLIHCVPHVFRLLLTPNQVKASGNHFKELRWILLSGEPITPADLVSWYDTYGERIQLVNLWGTSETTLAKTCYFIHPPDSQLDRIPVGKAIPGARVVVLDENRDLCEPLVTGELYIKTPYRSFGYLNDPELNHARFIKTPFGGKPCSILHKTGDIGRMLPGGDIIVLRRNDRQVKIRGIRIELEEIERVLLKHPRVKEAVVLKKELVNHNELLSAYIVERENDPPVKDPLSHELNTYLAEKLPGYMVPGLIDKINRIPRTPGGKIDYAAIVGSEKQKQQYIPPQTQIQRKLEALWSGILKMKKISITSNFFSLGGNSFNVMSMIARIHRDFGIKIPIGDVFKHPTIEQLAEIIIQEDKQKQRDKYAFIEAVEKKDFYALSSAQKRLYILQQMELGSTAYNMSTVVVLEGELNNTRLEETFIKLIKRHESLRTYFPMINGEPVQRIHAEVEFEFEYYDLQVTGASDRWKEEQSSNFEGTGGLAPLPVKNFIRPFDLARAPLMRVCVQQAGEKKYVLAADMHHIITDGTSMGLLINDFMALYKGDDLPTLRVCYKDYSQWQNRCREQIKQQEEYWLKVFAGDIPVLNLPIDFARPLTRDFTGRTLRFTIAEQCTRDLNQLASQQGATLFMVLIAIYNVVLAKITGQEDIVVGTPLAGRRHADLEPIIGMFVNTLCLRNYPGNEKRFIDFLHEVKENTLGAFENQEYQFEDLVEKVVVERDTSRNPLFDVMLVLQNMEISQLEIPGLKLGPFEYEKEVSKFDLTLTALEGEHELYFIVEYCTALLKEESIKRMIEFFKTIASIIVTDPGIKISGIEIISKEEKDRVLYDFNNTRAPYPGEKTIHRLFAAQVERTPDHTALVGQIPKPKSQIPNKKESFGQILNACGEASLRAKRQEPGAVTYKELNQRVNRLAHLLQEKGVQADTIVGIMMERSIEMIIGILGILKAGGAYLSIEPDYPPERIDYMLNDSGAKILLTWQEIADLSSPSHLHLPPAPVTSLAYIIYTSGSTGKPKGVMIEHKSVVNLLSALHNNYPFKETDTYLLKTSYVFDVSVTELFGWFLGGGRLVILEKGGEKDPQEILETIEKAHISHINFVPSMFNVFVDSLNQRNIGKLSGLKYTFLAGEALLPELVDRFRRLNTTIAIENLYGPTEATVYASSYSLSYWQGTGAVPIGKPLGNVELYILDRNLNLQPMGVPGELSIAGAGVARGYLNQPELTAEKFVLAYSSWLIADRKVMKRVVKFPMSYELSAISYIYKTGDLARWQPDGNIELLGRFDDQVKIRGFRVELGEIRHHLLNHSKIKETVVTVRQGEQAEKYICAYLVSKSDLNVPELREYLTDKLPQYMVPAYFVQLNRLPLTPTGKIDRQALPAPEEAALGSGTEYVAPTNELENLLLEIWGKVLVRNPIGIHDNFFILGGDSIKAIQIVSMMAKTGYKVEMKDIFQSPKISELAHRVIKLDRTPDQAPVTGIVPLTPIQKEFFAASREYPHHFNQAVMLYSKDGFPEETLIAIFTKIQEHHDALRMVYREENGEIIQKNAGLNLPLSLQVFDFQDREHEGRKKVEEALACEVNKVQASMDLQKGPLLKLALFHLAEEDRLLVAVHHLVIDGVSWRILFEDIETLYQQYIKKEPLELPLKTDSFKLWSEELSQYANRPLFLKQKAYWSKLESSQVPTITKDFNGENYIKDKTSLAFTLDKDQTEHLLTEVNEAFATEINDILLAALGLSINKTFGITKVLIALEGHGREEIIKDINISRTVGWFTSLYPVLLDMSYADDLSRHIKEVKENLHQVPDKGIGYGILKYLTAEENKKDIQFKLKPRISFNYLGQFDRDAERVSFGIDSTSVGMLRHPEEQADYELDVNGMIANKELALSVVFSKKQFKTEVIESLLHDYRKELDRIISYCISQGKQQHTPSDFTYKELSIEQLDSIFDG
jgi:amino acid adenylation domain-containing protein/non-ribosomal peptide synthase protein (TIGR01720 family)